ncbi:MAG: M42 family metallopeptidase [Syntrophobacteraceae bacterium]|nr:M42 family metallopeptidase [Syntrophobacteraceae bacterium]
MNDSRKEKGVELLEKLSQAHGAPGQENEVRRIFRKELGETVRTDRAGNIFFEKKGSSDRPRIFIPAHMDEVGLAVQAITDEGHIRFVALGGWWAHTLLAKRVRIRTAEGVEIPGVIGAKPPHFLSAAEREKVMNIEEMFIDVGARDGEEVRAFGISLGDAIVPESSFTRMRNPDLLLSKAFDDRAGLSAVIQAAQETDKTPHPNTIIFSGTVQEEVGTRGARAAVFSAAPDLAIVVEGAPADDLPGIGKQDRQAAIGCGPQIRLMDQSAILNREFIRFVTQTAQKNSIPYQLAVRRQGGTDAAPIHLHASGVPTVVIAVPSRYVHTHNTILDISDYLNTVALVLKLIETLDEETAQRIGGFAD